MAAACREGGGGEAAGWREGGERARAVARAVARGEERRRGEGRRGGGERGGEAAVREEERKV